MGALTADRKTLAMAKAAIAADLHQTGDILTSLTTEIAFDGVVSVDVITHLGNLFIGEVTDAGIGVHASGGADLLGCSAADAIDIGKTDLNALLAREVDTVNTGHLVAPLVLL